MISSSDSLYTFDLGKYYAITSSSGKNHIKKYSKKIKNVRVKEGFNYSSDKNLKFLSVAEIKKLVELEF